jgi:NADH-quinone oxidoreductase subunit M
MPVYATIFMLFTMANVGLPGTSGFIGEFLSLLGAFQANTWVAFFATTGVILSAGYALWLYRKVIWGELDKPSLKFMPDLSLREFVILLPLAVLTILLGVWPEPIFQVTTASIENLLTQSTVASAPTIEPAALAAR